MIIAAAIKHGSLIHILPKPARHHDIIREMVLNGYDKPITGEQGFINDDGEFLDRKQALKEAEWSMQVNSDTKVGNKNHLFSEDVW